MGKADCENMIRCRGGFDSVGSALENMGVDHGGFNVPSTGLRASFVPEEFLYSSYCHSRFVLKEVGGEGV
jgi:hypothetical protein